MMKDYVVGRGNGFDKEGRAMLRLLDRTISEGFVETYELSSKSVSALVVAPTVDEMSLLESGQHQADLKSLETLSRAAREGRWIVLLAARGMPDGAVGMIVRADRAFIPDIAFDPLAGGNLPQACTAATTKEFGLPAEKAISIPPKCVDDLEYESGAERARSEPDEAVVWVRSDGLSVCLAHKGGFLYWAAHEYGPDCKDIGFSKAPGEPGFYFFSGKPWSTHGGLDDEYDSGISGSYAPLLDEHLVRFAVTRDGLGEMIREYEEEAAPTL